VVAERLLDLTIIQMGLAGMPQHTIRKVVGCDMVRVVNITRHLKPWARRPQAQED
jgi:hypothetical protein